MSTRVIKVGNKLLGGNNPILIQTMADIKTSKVDEVVKEAQECEKIGADLIRFSVLDDDDIEGLKIIKRNLNIPIVADIHFDYLLAIKAINAGVDKIRINPGNIPDKYLKEIVFKAKDKNIPIRIGINSGSYQIGSNPDKFLNELESYIQSIERFGYNNLVLSIKSSNPQITYELNKYASYRFDYPLHLGVTEAGFGKEAIIKSTVALAPLLSENIGDTIRISLSESPIEEIKACKYLLKSLGLKNNVPTLVSCPTCGRTTVNVFQLVRKVDLLLTNINKDIKVAVMGCPVNGPGEAKDADIAIAGIDGNFIVFKKGKIIFKADEDKAFNFLKDEIEKA